MGALQRKTTSWTTQRPQASLEAAVKLYPGRTEFNSDQGRLERGERPGAVGRARLCGTSGNDFSLSLNPTSANVTARPAGHRDGRHATTSGSAQSVIVLGVRPALGRDRLLQPGLGDLRRLLHPDDLDPAGAASGTYSVTVTGDGTGVDRTATFTLTVGAASNVVFSDTFETGLGWTTNASGTDTAASGAWERGDPAATTSAGTALQIGTTVSGTNGLVTGRLAGTAAGDYDVDGGLTSIRSPEIALPTGNADAQPVLVSRPPQQRLQRRLLPGSRAVRHHQHPGLPAAGRGLQPRRSLADRDDQPVEPRGQTVRILIETADTSTASLIEAGVDNVTITRS